MRPKSLSKFLEGIYKTCSQTIKLSHCDRPQTRWEHLAHQGLILGVDSHSLVEVTYVLHRVCSIIIDGERWLIESPRKFCPFNFAHERRLGNLVQRRAHCVISQAFAR